MKTDIGFKSMNAMTTALGGAGVYLVIVGYLVFFEWDLNALDSGQVLMLAAIGLAGVLILARALWLTLLPKVLVKADERGVYVYSVSRSERFVPFSDIVDVLDVRTLRRGEAVGYGKLYIYGKSGHLSVGSLEDVQSLKAEIQNLQIEWVRKQPNP